MNIFFPFLAIVLFIEGTYSAAIGAVQKPPRRQSNRAGDRRFDSNERRNALSSSGQYYSGRFTYNSTGGFFYTVLEDGSIQVAPGRLTDEQRLVKFSSFILNVI